MAAPGSVRPSWYIGDMDPHIPFNRPHLTGKEVGYVMEAVERRKLSGNGDFTRRCQRFLEQRYGFGRVLLTTSCTDALEMSAMLATIEPGDEVIVEVEGVGRLVNRIVSEAAFFSARKEA